MSPGSFPSAPQVIRDLVSSCSAVLLDLNETFAFDCDRFDPTQDFASTYSRLGGRALAPAKVQQIIVSGCQQLFDLGRDSNHNESFPAVAEVLRGLEACSTLSDHEINILTSVIGSHEVGRIPSTYASAVEKLSSRFPLGLVSNIWAPSEFFARCLSDAGVENCFQTLVFSSQHGITKPSPAIFEVALTRMDLEPSDVIYVGNSLRRDVLGAKNAGIRVVWINAKGEDHQPDHEPDAIVSDFRDFVIAAL